MSQSQQRLTYGESNLAKQQWRHFEVCSFACLLRWFSMTDVLSLHWSPETQNHQIHFSAEPQSSSAKLMLVYSFGKIRRFRRGLTVSFMRVCVPQECGCHSLHAGDRWVSVCRRRQAGDVPERVPGQRGLQQGDLLQGVWAGGGLHPQAVGQSARVSKDSVWAHLKLPRSRDTVTWSILNEVNMDC